MKNDPIVEETRKLRDKYAARHGYDIHRIADDLRALERQGFPQASKRGAAPAKRTPSPTRPDKVRKLA